MIYTKPCCIRSASPRPGRRCVTGQDHRQCSLGAWMLPAGQEKQSPHVSGLEEGPGAHRLGQMGLVQGDESAP